jgi:hypothetical protein
MVKRKSTNNDLQNITHKTKDRVTRTPLKTGAEIRCFARVSSSCSTSGTHRNDLKMNIIFYFIYSLKNKNKCRNFQIFNLNIKNITLTFSEEVLCLFDLVFYLQNRISTVQRIKKTEERVCNATFNNISVTSWQSVLLGEETEENRPVVNHWQTLSHNVVSSMHRPSRI